jgi:hypothetical protein
VSFINGVEVIFMWADGTAGIISAGTSMRMLYEQQVLQCLLFLNPFSITVYV